MQNRIFFPQEALDAWIVAGHIDLGGSLLTVLPEGRSYRVVESVRVVREVTGQPDPHEVVGKVRSRQFFEELGAELLEGSMILGDNAYDVVQGWAGAPSSRWGEFVASAPSHALPTDELAFLSALAEREA